MKKVIVIAGGTGFVGKAITRILNPDRYEFRILTRKHMIDEGHVSFYKWDAKNIDEGWRQALEGAHVLINLTGKSVNCRYTEKNKQEIYDSRVGPTALLGEALNKTIDAPTVWINASTATIYRHEIKRPNDEYNGAIGRGFSVDVAKKWEQTFFKIYTPGVRKIALRMSFVLGREGEAISLFKKHTYMGLNKRHGTGKQWVSWIHEKDLCNIIDYIIHHDRIDGIVNATSPGAVQDRDFLKAFRQVLGVNYGVPIPAWMLTIGAYFLRTETELILKSRWVYPKRLLDLGFKFKFKTIEYALRDLLVNSVGREPLEYEDSYKILPEEYLQY